MQSFPADLRIENPVATLAGAAGLSAINTNELPNGALCVVNENNSIYQLRKTSAAAAASPQVIVPAAGPGRWHLYGQGPNSFTNVDLVVGNLNAQVGVEIAGLAVSSIIDNDDVVVFALRNSNIPAGLIVSMPRVTGPGAFALQVFNASAAPITGNTYSLRVAVLPSP
jgi:hypothetical protein